MSRFLEDRRDWKIDQVRADRDKGLISEPAATEQIVLINEQYDKARRWRDNVA